MDQIKQYYDQAMELYKWAEASSDPRLADWPLMSSPLITYVSAVIYVIFVWKVGPWLMRDRAPFDLRKWIVVYNIAMSAINAYIFKELLFGMIDAEYTWPCQDVPPGDDPKNIRIVTAMWLYFISKPVEYADTIFFVLRKKYNQVSFLHVYHHATVPMLLWIWTKWVPGGLHAQTSIMNAFIHILMYGYYGVAALGPQYQKFLWWKRYLTQMQLIQFCLCIAFSAHGLVYDCPFPRSMSWILIIYMCSFLFLFGNFYLQSYIKGKRLPKSDAQNKKNDMHVNGHANGGPISNGAPIMNGGMGHEKSEMKQD